MPWTVIHLVIDSLIEESLTKVLGGVFRATWKWIGIMAHLSSLPKLTELDALNLERREALPRDGMTAEIIVRLAGHRVKQPLLSSFTLGGKQSPNVSPSETMRTVRVRRPTAARVSAAAL